MFQALAEAGVPTAAVESPGTGVAAGRPGLEKVLASAGVSDRWDGDTDKTAAPPTVADPRLIRLLLKAADDPNVRFENGETALIRAVRQDLEEGVELLLDKGADVNQRDSHGHSALWHASKNGNPEIVKFLIAAGATTTDRRLSDRAGRPDASALRSAIAFTGLLGTKR